MSEMLVRPARPEDLPTAASIASQAMADLPEVAVVFKGNQGRMRSLWNFAFDNLPGQITVASEDENVVGVMRIVQWPDCKPSPASSLRFIPTMLLALRGSVLKGMRHQATWAKHDPQKPHWHLDPLAVLPERQGNGIGTKLMDRFCEFVDSSQSAAYLETGTTENVRFYEKFGFAVREEVPVNGVNTWLMWRPARPVLSEE